MKITTPKILAFAGSTRIDSYNKKLVKIAAAGARKAGAEVTVVDLRDLPMPLYDGDLEAQQGFTENIKKLRALMVSHNGFLIASPEYNSGISGVLKNAIDWASRPFPGEASLACFAGKTAVLMSASPGGLGGLRGLVQVRSILSNLQVLVLPEQMAVSKADTAFNSDGTLSDIKQQAAIEALGQRLAGILVKLSN
ncbi:MAG: NAD(P)H-dependent oxidoreductase [Candidatus Omnitrophica bacterium]|nr:NAD(P)H-dependent oxidoreductase [Candidatus Omnitrophota bacterium]